MFHPKRKWLDKVHTVNKSDARQVKSHHFYDRLTSTQIYFMGQKIDRPRGSDARRVNCCEGARLRCVTMHPFVRRRPSVCWLSTPRKRNGKRVFEVRSTTPQQAPLHRPHSSYIHIRQADRPWSMFDAEKMCSSCAIPTAVCNHWRRRPSAYHGGP